MGKDWTAVDKEVVGIKRQTRIELSRGETDWISARECFVRAFHRYPLYKYLIPDEKVRGEFLRAYLEATYEVTVRQGNCVLVCLHLLEEAYEEGNEVVADVCRKIIGAVVFVPPAKNGVGWNDGQNDEAYDRAYQRFNLKQIDADALTRLVRYEKWEAENVERRIFSAAVPLWNGLFCAIDPAYAGKGCGSLNYAECMRVLAQVQENNQTLQKGSEDDKNCVETDSLQHVQTFNNPTEDIQNGNQISPRETDFSQRPSLNHKCSISASPEPCKSIPECIPTSMEKGDASLLPMVIALSHSPRAANFYERNGFQSVGEVPFSDVDVDDNEPPIFTVKVLVMDPFESGRVCEVSKALNCSSRANGR